MEVCERRWRRTPCQCPTEGKDRGKRGDEYLQESCRSSKHAQVLHGAIVTPQDLPLSSFYRRWSASTKTGTRFYPRPCLQNYLRLFNQRQRAILIDKMCSRTSCPIRVCRWARPNRSRYPSPRWC